MLQDVRQLIRGGDFMKFTMRFENAGSITFNIQSQIPAYDEGPSPTR
jgi:copper(I)-binding protein